MMRLQRSQTIMDRVNILHQFKTQVRKRIANLIFPLKIIQNHINMHQISVIDASKSMSIKGH